jgi:hypothetical protein
MDMGFGKEITYGLFFLFWQLIQSTSSSKMLPNKDISTNYTEEFPRLAPPFMTTMQRYLLRQSKRTSNSLQPPCFHLEVMGLSTNFQKSQVAPTRCDNLDLDDILQSFLATRSTFSMRYLGLPLSIYCLQRIDFQPLEEKIADKIGSGN